MVAQTRANDVKHTCPIRPQSSSDQSIICLADFNHTVQKSFMICLPQHTQNYSNLMMSAVMWHSTHFFHSSRFQFNGKPGVSLSDINIYVWKPFTWSLIPQISQTDIICPHNQTAARTNTDSKHGLVSEKHGLNDDALCWQKTMNTPTAVRGYIQGLLTQPMKPHRDLFNRIIIHSLWIL